MDKIKELITKYRSLNLFLQLLIPIFILFGLGLIWKELYWVIVASIVLAIGYYLYKLIKSGALKDLFL